MVGMRMSGNEDVNIQIFRLDEDWELPITSIEGLIGRGGAAIGEIEIDADEQAGWIFENETVLPKKPDCKSIARHPEFADAAHVDFTLY